MKKITLLIIAIAGIFMIAAGQEDPDAQMQVMVKMQALRSSLLSKDSAGLSKILADDVTYGHTNGLIQSKAQLIRSIMSGDQDYKTIEPTDMHIRVYGKAAVATTKSHVIVIYGGQTLDLNMFVTITWIKGKDDWKIVARQAVKQ